MGYGIKTNSDDVVKLSKYKNTGYKKSTLSELLKGIKYFSSTNKYYSYKFNNKRINMIKKLSSCKKDCDTKVNERRLYKGTIDKERKNELTTSRMHCDRKGMKDISDNNLKVKRSKGENKKILIHNKTLNRYFKCRIYKRKVK